MKREQLKQELKMIKDNCYLFPEQCDREVYANEMISMIGDSDVTLREELISKVFPEWIINGVYTNAELTQYLMLCMDEEHLRYHIGGGLDDSVYTRSYSALILSSIMHRHHIRPFLEDSLVRKLRRQAVAYYIEERDVRGYTNDGGWAHAMVHGAELLTELARCREFGREELFEILKALQRKVCQSDYVYIERETNRMARVVAEVAKQEQLSERDWKN